MFFSKQVPFHCQQPLTCRSSHRRCSARKGVLRNFAKFMGKHLCQSLFFNKVYYWYIQNFLKPFYIILKFLVFFKTILYHFEISFTTFFVILCFKINLAVYSSYNFCFIIISQKNRKTANLIQLYIMPYISYFEYKSSTSCCTS